MTFVADDLGAWLVGLLADAGRRKLVAVVLGDEQVRALHQACRAALTATAADLRPGDAAAANEVAMVVGEVFRAPAPQPAAVHGTLLEDLRTGIAAQLAVLDDPDITTEPGLSSADALGVSAAEVVETLAARLVREITGRGARGGPLQPLASQLGHDRSFLLGLRLEGKIDYMDSLLAAMLAVLDEARPGTRGQQRVGASPVVIGDLPQQPPGFVPRAVLLGVLDAAGPGVAVVSAVTGMRGVGKTQLVAAYARAMLAAGWNLVAWVNAEDASSLQAGLVAVAEAAGLAGGGVAQDGDAGRVVRHWLEADGDRCLIVFDNAIDADILRPYIPAAGAARVLITSNRQSLANLGTRVEVEVFTTAEALAFLAERTGLADTAGAGALAAELGYLPLALAQAAAVIAGQRLSYAAYLDRLQALPAQKYLTREPGQSYPRGTAEAIALSLEAARADDQGEVCTAVLEVVSVLSPAGVRRDMLYIAGQAGALGGGEAGMPASSVDEVLARLAEQSLLTFSVDGQAVIAHRLVLRVVRDALAGQGRLEAVSQAAALVLDARAAVLNGSQERPAMRDLAEQVMALQDNTVGLACNGDGDLPRAMLGLRLHALHVLNELGDSDRQAIAIGEPLISDFARVLGPGHPGTLMAQNNLASAYRVAGRNADAIALYEQALAVCEQAAGDCHPLALRLRNNLVLAYQEAGRAAEAIPLHEQILAGLERVLGPDHTDTLTSRNNLALAYQGAGRMEQAILLLEQTIADRVRVLGSDHQLTLTSRNNLAAAYWQEGRADEAIPLHQQILADRQRVLGPDHPSTLSSRNNLAASYEKAGRAEEAIPLHQRTVADLERVLGPDHPSTLSSRNNLATGYHQAGRDADAIPLLEQTLADREHVLGPDHPDTLTSRNNLAAVYQLVGRSAEAIRLHEQTLADRERILGCDHPDTLQSRHNLASARMTRGQSW